MLEALDKWFIQPILHPQGYNPVNTMVYALIFVAAVWLNLKLFEKWKVRVDGRFVLGILFWTLGASALRAGEDLAEAGGAQRNVLFVTPFIFILMYVMCIAVLGICLLLKAKKGVPLWKTWIGSGFVFALVALSQITITNTSALTITFAITISWYILFSIGNRGVPWFFTRWNTAALTAHMLDASATYVAITRFNMVEQHVLPSLFIDTLGIESMFLLKLLVVPAVLYLIDKYGETDYEKKYVKMIIILLGFGTGMRDVLSAAG